MGRKIIKVPAKVQYGKSGVRKISAVAIYARVSTYKEEQENSLEAQKDYFTKYVNSHPGWELYDVYVDEGISGTRTKHRAGFGRMLEDAFAGKIDLIVTKSVSRFARNTLDTLTAIRALKEHGVEIFFEKENIYTFDTTGEFLITILGSLAQEESRSISENIKWGIRAGFAEGRYVIRVKSFLGYAKNEKGEYIINKSEAVLIQLIYFLALTGETPYSIAELFTTLEIPTPTKKTLKWHSNVIEDILTNERYKGDALLQKKYVADYLTKRVLYNKGELPQYYVTDGHPAIIPKETFDYLQEKMKGRKEYGRAYSSKQSGHCPIVCGKCNVLYGRKIAHANGKYQRYFWRCNGHYKNKCKSPNLDEEKFMRLYYVTMEEWVYMQSDKLKSVVSVIADIFGDETGNLVKDLVDSNECLTFDIISCKILVEKVIVSDDQLKFSFIDGTEMLKPIEEIMPRKSKLSNRWRRENS